MPPETFEFALDIPGTWYLEDDGIAGNNISRLRAPDGSFIDFEHPTDLVSLVADGPGMHLVIDLVEDLGSAAVAVGSLTSPSLAMVSILVDNVVTTGRVTLGATGAIGEGSQADADADILAGELVLGAGTGIGTAGNALETAVGALEAQSAAGGIHLANVGDLAVGGLTGDVAGVSAGTTGDVQLVNLGSILLGEASPSSALAAVRAGTDGGNVSLTAIGADASIASTAGNYAITADEGAVTLEAGRDVALQSITSRDLIAIEAGRDVAALGVFFAGIAPVTLTAGRNVVVNGGLAAGGGDVVIAAGPGGTFSHTSSFGINANYGNVAIAADRMVLGGASFNIFADGSVTLAPVTAGRRINVGSATDTAAALELSDAELDHIVAPTVIIGSETSGLLFVSSALTVDVLPPNNPWRETPDLTLVSGGTIELRAGITTTESLTLRARDNLIQYAGTTIDSAGLSVVVDTPDDDPGTGSQVRLGDSVGAATITGGGDNDVLRGTGGADTIFGLGGNDTLQSNGGGGVLNGGAGADLMIGGAADDAFYVENAGDVVVEAAGGGSFDAVYAEVSYTLAGGVEVEVLRVLDEFGSQAINLTGNEFGQFILGNNAFNVLSGGGGPDTIIGRSGGDVIIGGAGDDYMDGGVGDNVYFVDSAGDVVVEQAGAAFGNDRIATSASYTLAAGVAVERLETIMLTDTTALNLTGNGFNQHVVGNNGNNTLTGGGGNDWLIGAGGHDTLVGSSSASVLEGGAGNDVFFVVDSADLVVDASGGGSDRLALGTSYTLPAAAEIEHVETIMLSGTTAINITGNVFAQMLVGNNGNNVLDGKGGPDVLIGAGGADTFAFTTALGGPNVDRIEGFAPGQDKIALDDAILASLNPGSMDPNRFVVGASAQDSDDRIVYNPATGTLWFDADGSGAGAAVQIAVLTGAPVIAASDLMIV